MCISTAQSDPDDFLYTGSCGDPGDVRSCTGPYDKILGRSFLSSERPLHDLAQVLMRRSCADSGEVLSEGFFAWSCTGPSEKIKRRSWWSPVLVVRPWSCTGPCEQVLGEILAKRSWHDLAWGHSREVFCIGGYLHDVAQDFLWRCCEDRALLKSSKRSLHDLAQVLAKKPLWSSCSN